MIILLWLILVASGVALLGRSLPWPEAWKLRKPLGCAVCCGGWGAVLVATVHTAPTLDEFRVSFVGTVLTWAHLAFPLALALTPVPALIVWAIIRPGAVGIAGPVFSGLDPTLKRSEAEAPPLQPVHGELQDPRPAEADPTADSA